MTHNYYMPSWICNLSHLCLPS